ncbi:MAG: 50S ribosomal protein L9 [Candidatus Thiodiazotropha lotti]|uniref:Large ribosomal subunit protein bL9 n=1 Tax=Candidatus Thiodiazotropha lotti TaxID=2792787 RepID=A0A9E4K2J7_9GAMM|nr:50S ribosomal protein L9 [Candidatus Thiodiazotropha endoloripes]MCG7874004.1 50S ribosomal protein L9 [Candidatus Thiodiazotropha lotti]MCG7903067.1 50S ribosomal protein L9 [Candidatus Thiodiazotropha weberae]MCG7921935.1 50S ribosomal protein L9 [Candidatus Thiodiazotropha lotti]MCG7931543.1 50S ribosomal protein L9 [Candidatus Thiodiazotropha lotti]MCG7938457.1 50S ribosomal protein L9 [Candidatus Thiodiazotropha lotti]
MEIILLQKVDNLGDLGEKVNVKSGFGRNFLIPSGKAIPATEANLKVFEQRRAELEKEAQEKLQAAEARKAKLDGMELSITCKAGDEGRLFGSVGTSDIAKAASAAGESVEKKEVMLPNGPFRIAGEYEVDLHLHADVDVTIKLTIVPEA